MSDPNPTSGGPDPKTLSARLVDVFSDAVIVADDDNRIIFANEAVRSLLEWEPRELEGRPLVTVVPARFRPRHLAAYRRFVETSRSTIMGSPIRVPARRRDGTEVDIDLTLSSFNLDGARFIVGALRDAGKRTELEREAEMTRHLLGVLAQATTLEETTPRLLEAICRSAGWEAGALWLLDEEARELWCFDFWHDPSVDVSSFEEATRTRVFPAGVGLPGRVWATAQPLWIPDLDADPNFPRAAAARGSGVRSAFSFPVTADRRFLGAIEMFSRASREADEGLVRAVSDIGRELGHFVLRKRLERNVEERGRHLAFLADASRILASSLDYRVTLQQLAGMAVPLLADWAVVDVVEQGRLELVAAAHAEPEKERLIRELRIRYPPRPQQLPWTLHVVRTGSPMLHSHVDPELLSATALDGDELAILQDLGLRSSIVVPLVAKGQILGALTLNRADAAPPYGPDEVAVAEDLARRMALAIDNARLYEKQAYIASTLQRSLLPSTLPEIPGVELAATYRPARAGLEVGGDFYDVFRTQEGWAAVVGDVSGKGVEAAALTSMIRYTIRAAALTESDPSRILTVANDAVVEDLPESRYCTVSCATLRVGDGGSVVACVSCAGHPPPLLIRADGEIEESCSYGQAIGLLPEPSMGMRQVDLAPGDVMLFYTDGVTDCWPEGAEEALRASARRALGLPAAEVAAAIQTEALIAAGGRPRDDIAILVLRLPPEAGRRHLPQA